MTRLIQVGSKNLDKVLGQVLQHLAEKLGEEKQSITSQDNGAASAQWRLAYKTIGNLLRQVIKPEDVDVFMYRMLEARYGTGMPCSNCNCDFLPISLSGVWLLTGLFATMW